MTGTPSMQDERNRIEAELKQMTARYTGMRSTCARHAATIASLSEEKRVLAEARDALLFALYDMRFMWAGHAEECAYVLDRPAYKAKCNCDWPLIHKPADAAIIKATKAGSLDEAISAIRADRVATLSTRKGG